jgi:hypothetical protein
MHKTVYKATDEVRSIMRDKRYERQALAAIGRQARADSITTDAYARQVAKRLDHGASIYGDDGWWHKPGGVVALCGEIADEGTDLTGWILGTLQVINDQERQGRIDRDAAYLIKFSLMQAAAFALQSWQATIHASQSYREATGDEDLHAPPHHRFRAFSDQGD